MRAFLLLVVVISVGVPVALLDAAPVQKDFPLPPLLVCTGPKGADAKTVRASQQAWSKYLGEKSHEKKMALDKEGKVLIEMVLVPPGKYYRGSPEGKGKDNEHPQKLITISKPMWVGKYEITQAQYTAVTRQKNPSRFAKGVAELIKYPVEMVSHDNAVGFCQASTGGRFQLLTEAQWEYAYRAGGRTEWYGDYDETSLGEIAQFSGNNDKAPAEVGSKAANAFGLHDMAGNVSEWCSDWYDSGAYDHSLGNDPIGPECGSYRVVRGGNWGSSAGICRASCRLWLAPELRGRHQGFRVCVIFD